MASERELNLLIRARDEATKTIKNNQRAFNDLERSIGDVERASGTLDSIPEQMERSQKEIRRTTSEFHEIERAMGGNERSMRKLNRSFDEYGSTSRKALGIVPEHLKDISEELKNTQREFETLRRTAYTVDELNKSLVETRVSAKNMTSVSEAGKQATREIEKLTQAANKAKMATMGLNGDGTIKLSTAEAVAAVNEYQDVVKSTTATMIKFKQEGNLGAYEGGMMALRDSIDQVSFAMDDASRSGSHYFRTMDNMGLYTSNNADRSALAMERYRDRFVASINRMQSRATAGEQIQASFVKMGRPLLGVTKKLNGVSSSMERMAKAGAPAAVALKMLGPTASMSELLKMTKFLSKGIARITAVAIVAGIALAAFTYIMARAAAGPNPTKVFEEQQAALKAYADTLASRTDEIYNTWQLFEEAQITHTTGATLMKNLQNQVNILRDWSKNLGSLVKKGVDEGMIAELRKMGPAAAGEIAALNNMSGPELDKYVELWRQKHNLAKVAAVTELQGLKEETKKKIQELQNSLKPLGVSFQKFKNVWMDALGPFIEVWGIIAAKVVDFMTYIGSLIVKLNELNPGISAAAGMFLYLFIAITLILAPLAAGISRAGGLALAFKALWGAIGPFITGFLAVAAYAAAIAAAFVLLGYAAVRLWQNSELLRYALVNGFEEIKTAVLGALSPLLEKFSELKDSFMDMVSSFTGGTGTMGDIWKTMGDKIGLAIIWVVDNLLPILVAGIEIVVQVISAIIDGLIFVFGKITEWWSTNSGTIGNYLAIAKGYFLAAFTAIKDFIMSVMPQVSGVVTSAIDLIKTVFSVAMPIISAVVKVGFAIVKTVMTVLWPIIVSMIKGAWNNIKNVVTSGIAIIQNVIQLFSNILKGNWGAAWENVKAILKNAVIFLWNAVQLYFLGRIIGSLRSFATSALSGIKAMWTSISTTFTSTLTAIKTGVSSSWTMILTTIKNAMSAIKTNITTFFANAWVRANNTLMLMRTGITTVFNFIKTIIMNAVNFYKNIITTGFNLMKTGAITAVNAMKNGISTALNAVKTLFTTMKTKIISTVKSINLMQIGKDIIKGLINGIGSMASAAWDAVKNIADGIKNAITGALKIKSPSRIAIEIGGFFSEGLAIGIERMAKKAFEQAHNLADGVVAPVKGGQLEAGAVGYKGGASGSSKNGNGAVYVTFEAGAFDGAFPGVTKGEEVAKAVSGVSLKTAFKLQ